MRLFFGLDIPGDSAREIALWRERQFPGIGREVPQANFHITLAFLGELAPAQLDRLCQAVEISLERSCPGGGQILLDQVGYWPRPGILWLGPSHCPAGLEQLASRLQTVSGGKRERRAYQPHVTLFRRCDSAPPAPLESPSFACDYQDFALFESVQGRRGVHYQPVAHWQLQ